MNIAICDADEVELLHIVDMLKEYKSRYPAFDVELSVFSSAAELAKQKLFDYHLFILGPLLPKISGIEFATSLRAASNNAAIVFIAASPNFAFEAFGVNATQYLLKPVEKEKLFNTIDSVWLASEQQRENSIVVSTQDGIQNFYLHNIVFVECARHFAFFHLSDGTRVSSRTLRQSFVSYIAPLLNDDRFMHPHHSFCINKNYIVRLNPREFEMFGGHVVPIAKERYAAMKSYYLNFLTGEEEANQEAQ